MRAHEVFGIAHDLAAELGHAEVTPLHILLAIVREGRSPAVAVLHSRGVDVGELTDELEKQLPPLNTPYEPEYLWRAADEMILHEAAEEAGALGHEYQGCEHILLALLRDSASIPALLLAQHGLRFADAQAELLRLFGSPRISDSTDGTSPAL